MRLTLFRELIVYFFSFIFVLLLLFRKRIKCKISGHKRYDEFGKIYLKVIYDIGKKDADPYVTNRCMSCSRIIEIDEYDVMIFSKYT